MAIIYKDWKIRNLRIWLAKIDNDRGLDFFILTDCIFRWKSFTPKYKNTDHFFSKIISKIAKTPYEKKKYKRRTKFGRFKFSLSPFVSKMPASTTSYIKRIKFFLFALGAFHLVTNSENSCSGQNGKHFFGLSDWKIPRESGPNKLQSWQDRDVIAATRSIQVPLVIRKWVLNASIEYVA